MPANAGSRILAVAGCDGALRPWASYGGFWTYVRILGIALTVSVRSDL